jgi:hypothetical protein
MSGRRPVVSMLDEQGNNGAKRFRANPRKARTKALAMGRETEKERKVARDHSRQVDASTDARR